MSKTQCVSPQDVHLVIIGIQQLMMRVHYYKMTKIYGFSLHNRAIGDTTFSDRKFIHMRLMNLPGWIQLILFNSINFWNSPILSKKRLELIIGKSSDKMDFTFLSFCCQNQHVVPSKNPKLVFSLLFNFKDAPSLPPFKQCKVQHVAVIPPSCHHSWRGIPQPDTPAVG